MGGWGALCQITLTSCLLMLKANCTKVQFAFSLHLKKLNIREGILRADGSIVDRRWKSCIQSCYMSWLVYAVVYLGANTAVCWSSRWLLRSDCHSVFNMHARWLDIHWILSLWQLRPSSRGTTCWSDNICAGCDWLVLSWLCAGELKWISSQFFFFSYACIYHNWSATKQRPHPQSVVKYATLM